LLASGLIGIMSVMSTSLPHAEAQLTPTRGLITVYQTVYETIREVIRETVREILHETIHETMLQTVHMPVTVTSYSSIAWTVTAPNYGLPRTTSHSISVTGWTRSSSQMCDVGLAESSPSLGPNPLSAAPLLAAGAVAGVAVAQASRMLLSRLRGTVSADRMSASDANSSSGTGGVALLETSKDAVSNISSTETSIADAAEKTQDKITRDMA